MFTGKHHGTLMHPLVGTTQGSRQILDSRVRSSSGGHPVLELLTRCKCGAEKWVRAGNLRKSRQCRACALSERKAAGALWTGHPLFPTWWGMNARCHDPANERFNNYGARGVYVCSRWRRLGTRGDRKRFFTFLEDMGGKPTPNHSIDRVDNDGPYEPENCRWASREVQQNNRRDNLIATWNGKTQSLHEWARELGVPPAKLEGPIHRHGLPLAEVLPRVTQARSRWVDRQRYPRLPRVRTQVEQQAFAEWEADFDSALARI